MSRIPKGWYTAEPVDHVFDAVGANKTECLKITFRIAGGEMDGEEVGGTEWMTDAAAPFTIKKVQEMGGTFDADDNLSFPDGTKVRIFVQDNENGYPEVEKISTKGKGASTAKNPEVGAKTKTKAAALMRALRGERKPDPAPWGGDEKGGGSDVPF